ncbi:hypothetical protein CSKR_104915 [Clonorchis sinensis]|uniref:Uncharacterized protein n=1 Tax=Clonorchis sinensis TaxID=79923 RepID=A0A419Q714_CLOSI|nr:hypothetical protein CSKR_104915 [Clonorchis sinensis]
MRSTSLLSSVPSGFILSIENPVLMDPRIRLRLIHGSFLTKYTHLHTSLGLTGDPTKSQLNISFMIAFRLGQPDSIPALVQPSIGMAVRYRKVLQLNDTRSGRKNVIVADWWRAISCMVSGYVPTEPSGHQSGMQDCSTPLSANLHIKPPTIFAMIDLE